MLRRMEATPSVLMPEGVRRSARGASRDARGRCVRRQLVAAPRQTAELRGLLRRLRRRLGIPESIPEDAALAGLPGWFFPASAAGQMVLAWLACWLAEVARVRPAVRGDDTAF